MEPSAPRDSKSLHADLHNNRSSLMGHRSREKRYEEIAPVVDDSLPNKKIRFDAEIDESFKLLADQHTATQQDASAEEIGSTRLDPSSTGPVMAFGMPVMPIHHSAPTQPQSSSNLSLIPGSERWHSQAPQPINHSIEGNSPRHFNTNEIGGLASLDHTDIGSTLEVSTDARNPRMGNGFGQPILQPGIQQQQRLSPITTLNSFPFSHIPSMQAPNYHPQAVALTMIPQVPRLPSGSSTMPNNALPAARVVGKRSFLGHQNGSPGIPLSLKCDSDQLSEYQILVRKQLELFEASEEDVSSNTQGRKKQLFLGQVGIRCRHCARSPLRKRGKGAVYYPMKLQGVYQASQNMAKTHLCEACKYIPPQLKAQLCGLRRGKKGSTGEGKQYWAYGAKAMGLKETVNGLKLEIRGWGNGS